MPLVTTIARACPPILFRPMHLLVEVVDHDLGLERIAWSWLST